MSPRTGPCWLASALLLTVAAATSLAAGPRVRWYPERGPLDRNAMVLLLFPQGQEEAARSLSSGGAHLRLVRSSELVPLRLLEVAKASGLGGIVVAFRPERELKPLALYRFETRGAAPRLHRVFRTSADLAERLSARPPRLRRAGRSLRFTGSELALASWVHVEVQKAQEGESDEAWHEEYYSSWQTVASYLLAPLGDVEPPAVDLSRALGERPSGPHRVRFTLIGKDGFTGRPSSWRLLAFPNRS